jgi:hypothetical protein
MQQLKNIREHLAAILLHHTVSAAEARGRLALQEDTGLSPKIIENAVTHGLVESAELVLICQALDLDAAAVLAEAINHVCAPLDLSVEAPQPETHPA